MESPATASIVSEKSLVIQKKETLPAHINKLKSFVIFQEEVAKNYKSRLLLLKETKAAKAQVDATFEDALKVSEMLFQAYERLGELVERHTAKPKEAGKMRGKATKPRTGATDVLNIRALAREMRVSESWLAQMKLLSKNPRFAKDAFKTARELGPEAGTPPTKTQIVNTIRSAEKNKSGTNRSSKLGECTRAILNALNRLEEADWQNPPEKEVVAFGNAISKFQERLGEFQKYVHAEKAYAPEDASSEKSRRLQLPDLIQRWKKLNWKPLFRRLLTATASRA